MKGCMKNQIITIEIKLWGTETEAEFIRQAAEQAAWDKAREYRGVGIASCSARTEDCDAAREFVANIHGVSYWKKEVGGVNKE